MAPIISLASLTISIDFLQLFQSGIRNIVAVSGTALTNGHALQLKRFCKTIFLAYDGDKAGIAASIRGGYVLLNNGLDPQIVKIPKDTDPDDWVKMADRYQMGVRQKFENSMAITEKEMINLQRFSEQMLVPESTASQTKGAGAGVVDTD